ncbi:choice-of-anchor B family protein [Constantimarinum furrinae]|uniref:HYR domain-containing protein n=1 Tax=Constantimarinum furrinae TaxID=2562285 RepID=A0A7G8PSL6_9FLAO|nr:choice-of-anchor B family protein [Constantimarinum furrinae]QNJ97332.1 hypothetical protein ALE3EI_0756 [Constantimarinum furrinae]
MKKVLLSLLLVSTTSLFAQTPCTGGTAGPYPCDGYILQSEISLGTLNAGAGNDSWGWTDPSNGNEYAIVGLNNGTAFINISNPNSPVYLGKLPTHTSNSTWRDVKVYNNHAFIVSEANGHGMQVFDLTRLRNVPSPPATFNNDAHYNGFGRAHNIVINEDSGYAYAVGTSTFNGGPHFIDISNPTNPTAAGGYAMDQYSHDAQVVIYCGPDKDYAGREILIGSNEDEVIIADITDKSNPVNISSISYGNVGYTHQGWFTEDQRYFLLGDETDEQGVGFNTRTIVFDFEDLDDPQLFFEYSGPTPAIDHNGYVKGTKYYMANYRAGLRVIDVSDIANGTISEEGSFDTYPTSNSASFSGAWSVYPYFESGNIVISDINRGFILVKAQVSDTTPPVANCSNITVSLDANGSVTISGDQLDNGSSDNSGTVYFLLCEDTFDCSDLGANTVELVVYDDFGNRDSCTATVTVVDDLGPQIDCPANFTVAYDSGESFYTLEDFVANGAVSATDNCTSNLTIDQSIAPGTQLTVGTYTITFDTTDDENNSSSCSFELTVVEVLGVTEENFELGLAIYPNPATEEIIIQSNNIELTSITLSDVSGKVIYSEANLSTNQKVINVAALPRGVYFMTLNNLLTKKVIKQ